MLPAVTVGYVRSTILITSTCVHVHARTAINILSDVEEIRSENVSLRSELQIRNNPQIKTYCPKKEEALITQERVGFAASKQLT